MSYNELMAYHQQQQQPNAENHNNNDDEVQRMLSDFEQYFSMDKQARQQKLQHLEKRQQRIDESLASIERKQQLQKQIEEQDERQERQQQQRKQQKSSTSATAAVVSRRSPPSNDDDQQQQDSSFLHNKVVQLAKALAKTTRDRDRLDLELAKTKVDLMTEKEKYYKLQQQQPAGGGRISPPNNNSIGSSSSSSMAGLFSSLESEKEIWKKEIVALRNALEHHVVSDRKDRHGAQQDKEIVLNEVAEELGQVMAQRDLAYVELEKLKRLEEYSKKKLSPSGELESSEKHISALQLQLAHARRDVTVQSVNLHVANEKYGSLKEDVEKVCSAFQTTSDQCNSVLSILSSAQQYLREKQQREEGASNNHHRHHPNNFSVKLTSSQISELMLFISRVRSDFSNISSLLQELRSDNNNNNSHGHEEEEDQQMMIQ